MKPRHAAALALVGWYLMVPPLSGKGVDLSAALSQWEEQAGFDSADSCERARARVWKCGAVLNNADKGDVNSVCDQPMRTRAQAKDKEEESVIASVATQNMSALCVSTDDPRLKGN